MVCWPLKPCNKRKQMEMFIKACMLYVPYNWHGLFNSLFLNTDVTNKTRYNKTKIGFIALTKQCTSCVDWLNDFDACPQDDKFYVEEGWIYKLSFAFMYADLCCARFFSKAWHMKNLCNNCRLAWYIPLLCETACCQCTSLCLCFTFISFRFWCVC